MKTICYDTPQGRTDAQAVVTAALTNTRAVLIVGGKPGFYGDAHQHPLVKQLSSVSPKPTDSDKRNIPSDVGVVLLTKYVSYDLHRSVLEACKRQGVDVVLKLTSPGNVRRLIMNDEGEEHEMGGRAAVPTPQPRRGLEKERQEALAAGAPLLSDECLAGIAQLAKLRDDATAAIDLLYEAAEQALRKADTGGEAERRLAALRAALL